MLSQLYSQGSLVSSPPIHKEKQTDNNKFWKWFDEAFHGNKKGQDGRIRILSVIAREFSYDELEKKLGVSNLKYI
jgi:hypothetical protein